MKLYIEGLTILAILFIFFIWFIWYKISERRLLKKYKPENDKGRKGNKLGAANQGFRGTTNNSNGLEQSEGRELLQETEVDNDGETTNHDGQSNKSNRKFKFIRRK